TEGANRGRFSGRRKYSSASDCSYSPWSPGRTHRDRIGGESTGVGGRGDEPTQRITRAAKVAAPFATLHRQSAANETAAYRHVQSGSCGRGSEVGRHLRPSRGGVPPSAPAIGHFPEHRRVPRLW